MMNFRIVNDAIINILGAAAAGQFRVIGYQNQGVSTTEVVGNNRMVQVYYQRGNFSKTSGAMRGPVQHDIIFAFDLKVAEPATGDLALLKNVGSTPPDRAAVLAAFQEASARADKSFSELAELVYQIIMDARNYDFGLEKGIVSDRWFDGIQKDEVVMKGEHVFMTGSMPLSCRVVEIVSGATGTPGQVIDTTFETNEDTETKAGQETILS